MPRLLNRGKRTITYGPSISNRPGESLKPEEIKDIPAAEAEKLLRFYPKEVVNVDSKEDMERQLTGGKGVTDAAPAASETISRARAEKEKKAAIEEAIRADRAERASAVSGIADDSGVKKLGAPLEEKFIGEADPEIAQKIDAMDRSTIAAFIEENGLQVDFKNLKNPDALKRAVFTAYEAKFKAE